jgi:hypothetical protein
MGKFCKQILSISRFAGTDMAELELQLGGGQGIVNSVSTKIEVM